MSKRTKSELLDDFSDVDGVANIYERCVQMKLKEVSNSDLREFLKKEGVSEEEAREMVRQIDSDYMEGALRQPSTAKKVTTPIVGILFICLGGGLILFQLSIGIISLWLILISGGLMTMGMGAVAKGYVKKSPGLERGKMRSQYSSWKKKI